jgi:integrator complex subunit 10
MLSGSGEKYLISKSKEAQNKDPCSAKAWILTAKTLYPNDFGVQVSIY